MKKILKLSLALSVLVTVTTAHASENGTLTEVTSDQGKRVTFASTEVKNVNLSIYDEHDYLINSEKINSKGLFTRTYDLKELPEGTYFLKEESDTKISKYDIAVKENIATIENYPSSEVFKPSITTRNGLVTLNILNIEKAPVNIKIFNSESEEVYNSTYLDEPIVAKLFNISSVKGETYTFITSYSGNVFQNTVVSW